MNTETTTSTGESRPLENVLKASEITRELILSLDPKVKMVDSDGDIELFSYTSCDDTDPEIVKACRGLVFKGGNLVLKSFSYTPTYTADDYETLNKYTDFSNYQFFESHEGALIRVFHIDSKWYVSTHRKLDAFKSKWSSNQSFGLMFSQGLEYEYATNSNFKALIDGSSLPAESSVVDKFISTLSPDKQYMFMIQNNNENRIVCKAPQYPRVLNIGVFCNGKLDDGDVSVLQTPTKLSFESMNDVLEYVENSIDIESLQGVIMYSPESQIKILNREYKYLSGLRGNESSVKFRYLQVRLNPGLKDDFMALYPEHLASFDEYENTLYEIVVQILNAYINRFINKKFVTMPPEEYSVMKKCHAWHLLDRSTNHISFNRVMAIMNEQDPSLLNRMIRRYINGQKPKNTASQVE
jgi:hypothetical protein